MHFSGYQHSVQISILVVFVARNEKGLCQQRSPSLLSMAHVLRSVKSAGVGPCAQVALQRRAVTGASEHSTEL